jgi:hypothetical protein
MTKAVDGRVAEDGRFDRYHPLLAGDLPVECGMVDERMNL